jgi:hypothetical protein
MAPTTVQLEVRVYIPGQVQKLLPQSKYVLQVIKCLTNRVPPLVAYSVN